MNGLGRALHAEAIKLKRSTALLTALVGPLVGSTIVALVLFSSPRGAFHDRGSTQWEWLGLMSLHIWCLLLLPLFLGLETALVAALEHRGSNWKHLFSQPVPRWAVFASKHVGAATLVAISLLSLTVGTAVVGITAGLLRSDFGLQGPVPLLRWAAFLGMVFVASWLALALQNWVALHSAGFAIPFGFAILATAMMVALGQVDDGSPWAYFPWLLPVHVSSKFGGGDPEPARLVLGAVGGLLVAGISALLLSRRDVR